MNHILQLVIAIHVLTPVGPLGGNAHLYNAHVQYASPYFHMFFAVTYMHLSLPCTLRIHHSQQHHDSRPANTHLDTQLQEHMHSHLSQHSYIHDMHLIHNMNTHTSTCMYPHLYLFTVYPYFVCINFHIDRYPRSLFEVCNSFCCLIKQDVALHANKFSLQD